jgi:hypothetical protein
LRFVGPEDDEIIATALGGGLVEPAQGVGLKRHLEEGVHVAALDLELLRHGDADDLAAVDVGEIDRARSGAKDLGDLRGDECLRLAIW